MHLKMSSVKWRPFCPGEDELTEINWDDGMDKELHKHGFEWDVITHPNPNFGGGLANCQWSEGMDEWLHPTSF